MRKPLYVSLYETRRALAREDRRQARKFEHAPWLTLEGLLDAFCLMLGLLALAGLVYGFGAAWGTW